MPALCYDLIIDQGTDYTRSIPVLGLADGDTLAGWMVAGQIRAGYASPTVLHTLDLTVSGTDIVLHIPAATSADWTWRRGRWDIEVIDPIGTVTRLVEGAVVIRPEITRA
jgi:hypothetical protein